MANAESTEAYQTNFVAAGQSPSDGVEDRIHGTRRIGF
jgi:hypothetical protein